jgi:hypothetical protein
MCHRVIVRDVHIEGAVHMQVITIGIDLAKHVFQVHGVDANNKVVFNKPLRRSQVLPFFAKLAPCLIGMEACASAHDWARELKKLGHDVRLMIRLIRPCQLAWRVDDIGEPSGGHPREGYCTDARRPVATESPAAVNAITGLILRVSIK